MGGCNMDNNYLISVLITNFNTLKFVKLALYALRKLTKNPYRVLINDNGSKWGEIKRLKQIEKENENIFVNFRETKDAASLAHGTALDILIEMVNTPYTIILDSDCTFLRLNWDEVLLGLLDDKIKIVGTPLPEGRSGNKPSDFPFQFAVMFETETYRRLNISCKPKDISMGQDTCWEWKPKFTGAGFQGKTFQVRNTRDFESKYFAGLVGVEEYYISDNVLTASHFGRGHGIGIAKYKEDFWYYKIPKVSGLIKRMRGKREIANWIGRCRRIIDSQCQSS